MTDAWPGTAGELLGQVETPVAGLHRPHPERNLAAVARAITGSFLGTGPVRLGPGRSLVVVAVDGLGYEAAAVAFSSAELWPLTSVFPTTTVACLMTAVTGMPVGAHGFAGVQYLHADGCRVVNCHSGQVSGFSEAMVRPTSRPDLLTVFDRLGAVGVPSKALPHELAGLPSEVTGRLLHGASVSRAGLGTADPNGLAVAFAERLTGTQAVERNTLTWAYLDFDSYLHRHGFDDRIAAGAAVLAELAQRLRDEGTSVLIFSDHGLTPSAPVPSTLQAWDAVAGERWCRLPPGGAGRVRWLYPHPGRAGALVAQLTGQFGDAFVTGPDELADLGLIAAGSIGQRRLGEVVLLATGPDFPVPDPGTGYEHGSLTAAEVLVPMAVWSAGQ
jgi:Type I phosphodiesterase / nucleotide pyrophosphatase